MGKKISGLDSATFLHLTLLSPNLYLRMITTIHPDSVFPWLRGIPENVPFYGTLFQRESGTRIIFRRGSSKEKGEEINTNQ
jgi:hypothetical protein